MLGRGEHHCVVNDFTLRKISTRSSLFCQELLLSHGRLYETYQKDINLQVFAPKYVF